MWENTVVKESSNCLHVDDGCVRGAHPKLVDFGLGDACMAEREERKRHLSKCFLGSSKKQTRISAAAPLASMGKTMRDLLRWGLSDLTVLARRQIQSA